jgi:hypothetical protein
MTPAAKSLALKFLGEMRLENPADDVDRSTRLQQYLVDQGLKDSYTEDDLADAAVAVGVPPDEVHDFLDELASWL